VGIPQDFLGSFKIFHDPKKLKRCLKVFKDPWRDKIMPNFGGFFTRICYRVVAFFWIQVLIKFTNPRTNEKKYLLKGVIFLERAFKTVNEGSFSIQIRYAQTKCI